MAVSCRGGLLVLGSLLRLCLRLAVRLEEVEKPGKGKVVVGRRIVLRLTAGANRRCPCEAETLPIVFYRRVTRGLWYLPGIAVLAGFLG